MDPLAILQQFTLVPVIALPLALVIAGTILWLKVVERFLPSPPAAVVVDDEPLIYTAVPTGTADTSEVYELEGVEQSAPNSTYL